MKRERKKGLRLTRILVILGLLAAMGIVASYLFWRPAPLERTEIYKGVFLTVETVPKSEHGSGRAMIIEVHWDTPGVAFSNRPFDFRVNPENPINQHYKLVFADWALQTTEASVLMNTAIYMPDSWTTSMPGKPVRSNETLVVNGQVSHIHAHSQLLYWDKDGKAHMDMNKAPDAETVAKAVTGIGLQGVQVGQGQARYNAIDHKEALFARTFIGVDPLRNILYLLAFEKASAYLMIERALEAGVIFGGQLDSGKSTNLLIGKHARDIRAHTGIRGVRPLGPYLTVSAEPL